MEMNVVIQVIEITWHYSLGVINAGNIVGCMCVCACINFGVHAQHYSLF